MANSTVDARGKLCPTPLIMTKKALREIPVGGTCTVLIDNLTSVENVERFLRENGSQVTHTVELGVYTLMVIKGQSSLPHPDTAAFCDRTPPPVKTETVICIRSDRMGTGADELGSILMKAFINTIKEVSPLPEQIIFYNSGILLAAEDSTVLPALIELERRGVAIIICGTCADYYQKKELLRVGTISNMYTILETLMAAAKIIYP
jgi:selenium metabolism protein YedF